MGNHKLKTKLNFLDIFFLITIFLSIIGVFAKEDISPLNKLIEKKERIEIVVFIQDVHNNNNLFKIGDEAGITIRNRPYTKLQISNVQSKEKTITIPTLQGTFKVIDDPTKTHLKDYYVTLQDTALKTKDGYIVGGNKIKIGNQVELEGFSYRLTGKIVSIQPALPK